MIRMMRAEFSYSQFSFLGLLLFIPIICIVEITTEDVPGFLILLVLYLPLQVWITLRNKENRDFLQVRLPVANWQIAAARILLVITFSLVVVPLYKLIYILFAPEPRPYQGNPLVYAGMIVLGFSIYFMMRDLFLVFLRKIGITKERMIMILLFIAIGLNIVGVYYFVTFSAVGAPLTYIRPFLEFLVGRSPLHSGLGLIKFLLVCGLSALITIITYGIKKSYLE